MPFFMVLALSFALSTFASLPQLKDARNGQKILETGEPVKAILFVGFLEGCPLFAKYQATLKDLKRQFGAQLLVVNFDPAAGASQSLRSSLSALKKLGNDFPVVLDQNGGLNAKLGITLASEVAVVRASDFELVYRGAIDDRVTLDFERPEARHNYVRDAVEQILAGKKGRVAFISANGCALNLRPSVK